MQDEDLGVNLATLDPDNLPEDMEALIAQLGGDASDINDEVTEEAPEADEKEEISESSTETQAEEEAPILSADGKHQIPYQVLKQEREARRAAAEQAAELQREIAALKQAQQAGIATPTDIPTYDPNDPDIQALESEFPEIARANRASRAEIDRLRQEMQARDARIEAMASQWEREQQAKHQVVMEEIHAAIDANPTLRYLRSEDGNPQMWEAAVAIDQELQNRPAWANKPVAERFAKVVERLEEDFGPVSVPSQYVVDKPVPVKKAKPVEKEELPINTLSDIRGGSSPESDGINLSSASTVDIQAMLQRMTPQQQEDWFARFA